MLSKNQIKLIKSLSQKKFREQHGLFTVEGIKGITEFLKSDFQLHHIFAVDSVFDVSESDITIISESDLKRVSHLKSPNTALAVFKIPQPKPIRTSGLIVALDAVRDPGNLGTIIRLCDWFGINDLVCSETTVDCFNNKVVQATMGSLSRVNITYLNLEHFIRDKNVTSYGTFLNGNNIYQTQLPKVGMVILGNEANGISDVIEAAVDERLTIPQFGDVKTTESLNVATATAIVLSEFSRVSIET
ncbi:MAG: RNA methyltransferase [Bacteroidota bacterium]